MRSSLNPTDNLYNIICPSVAISLLLVSSVFYVDTPELWADYAQQPKSSHLTSRCVSCFCAGAIKLWADIVQQPKSNRQPLQHHLCHQWPSHFSLCQLFSAQAHQNFEQTRRSSLNPTDNLYSIICAINGHLTSPCIICFLRRRTRTLSRLGAAVKIQQTTCTTSFALSVAISILVLSAVSWPGAPELNEIDNLYNIIYAISGHLTSHCIRCFLCRRTRTLSRLGAAA